MSDLKYVFAGDTEVGEGIVASIARAGFLPAQGVDSANVVFTYHPVQSGLEELYFGDEGLVSQVAAGTIFVDLSPSVPSFSRELYQLAAVHECNFVEAPVVMRDPTCEDAFGLPDNLLIFAAGEQAAYAAIEPMVQAIASTVEFLGEVGMAQTAKVAATIQNAVGLMGVVEALASPKASGMDFDPEAYLDVMTAAGLVSPSQEAFVQALIGKDFEGSYTVGLMMAELSCALTAVESEDMVLPMADAAFHLYELLAIVGGAQYNPAALSLIFSDEETCNEFGLDWSKAEAGHDHDHDDDDDDECDCGHHHDDDHECECGHHHHHHDAAADDDDEPLHHGHDHGEAFDEDGNYNEFGGYGTPSKTDYLIDEIDEWN